MTEIVPCRMCKGREDVEPPLLVKGHYYWVFCKTPNCGVEGPLSMANAEAIDRWNELMAPTPAPEPAAKLPKGFNQAALAEMIEKGFRLRGSYGPNPLKDMAEHAAQIVLSRIAVNATLAGAAAPEPAAGAVRVRIQVRYVQGQIQISYLRDQDGEELNFDEHGADKIVWITADIPLPQPTEIRGTVEASDDV